MGLFLTLSNHPMPLKEEYNISLYLDKMTYPATHQSVICAEDLKTLETLESLENSERKTTGSYPFIAYYRRVKRGFHHKFGNVHTLHLRTLIGSPSQVALSQQVSM